MAFSGGKRDKDRGGKQVPGGNEQVMSVLTPGMLVDLTVRTDLASELADVRRSRILAISGKGYIVLAQTTPPIGPAHQGKSLEVSFSMQGGNSGPRRLGCWVKLLKLAEVEVKGKQYPCLVTSQPDKLSETSLRLHYRVSPLPDSGLVVKIIPHKEEMEVVDISIGGVQLSHRKVNGFHKGEELSVALEFEGRILRLPCRVVRAGGEKTSVQFVGLSRGTIHELGKIVGELTRRLLQEMKERVEIV